MSPSEVELVAARLARMKAQIDALAELAAAREALKLIKR
jgi:hypothetical protein